ncbi:DUF3138 family protein [Rubrivivax gelatinosus]|uniref:DUF3138 family protein n=1 Tax=Rubrivivax gelatinosus TaxID=28068 RepID=UPI0002D3A33F|nr:DUF3138 family protein [Rubrivivax gelatinosus]MBG6082497.1 hypothetical protein [Rubrivivax gelatinosus]
MKPVRLTALVLAIGAAFPAAAQSNEDLLKELRALRDRVTELEKKLAAQPAAAPAPQAGQWGMTPEQAQELARIGTKTEALQDNFEAQGFKGLKITGQIDPTWIYNRRANDASFVLLNREDGRYTYDNSYFGMAVLDILKETESGTIWHLTLAPERGTGALINGGSIIHEASVAIPLEDLQTRLWVGQIPDWTGYEITLPAGNKLVTHNLLFDFMAPTAYTGAVYMTTVGKWQLKGGLANVNTARNSSGNKTPSLIFRADYAKGEFSGFGFSGLHGKLHNYATYDTDADGNAVFSDQGRNTLATLLEADAYFVRGDLSLFGQLSYGQQKKAAIYRENGLRDARWWGLSTTAAYKLTPRLEGVVRADYVYNRKNGGGLLGYSSDDGANGIGRGLALDADGNVVLAGDPSKGANRYALTVGANYRYDENTLFKLEYRYDGATQAVFEDLKDGGYSKNNHLLGASVVVSF